MTAGETRPYKIADEVFYATWPHMIVDGQRQPLPAEADAVTFGRCVLNSGSRSGEPSSPTAPKGSYEL